MTTETAENLLQTALDVVAADNDVRFIDGCPIPFLVMPEDYKVVELEEHLEHPFRKTGEVKAFDVDGFVGYVRKHDSADSVMYGNIRMARFACVLNDHSAAQAGWNDHYITYACPHSTEWQTWKSNSGKRMSQMDFAQFIEDNLPDIVSPVGADMLEISRSLEATKKVNFASAARLQNGQTELVYEEDIQGTAAKGKLQIPDVFVLGIRVFEGGDAYRVEARLRYRILDSDKKLQIWFDLVRPHKTEEAAVRDVWAKIEADTGHPILHASKGGLV